MAEGLIPAPQWLVPGVAVYAALWLFFVHAQLLRNSARLRRMRRRYFELRRSTDALAQRVTALERRGPPQAVEQPAPRHGEQQAGSGSYQTRGPARPAEPPSLQGAGSVGPRGVDAIADYNRLAADYSQALLERFRAKWQPVTVREVEGEQLESRDDGPLWFIPTDFGHGEGILVPGSEAIRTWEKFYRPMSGMKARSLLGSFYAIREGSRLSISRAATVRRFNSTIRLERPGELAGI